jgi:hypothetical protein
MISFYKKCKMSSTYLEDVGEIDVRVGEKVNIGVFIIQRGDPHSVDSEEVSKVVGEVVLFDVGSRAGRNPELLGVVLKGQIGS